MSGLQVLGRTGTFTWRMLATVLAGQSILLFFGALVARGNALARGDDGMTLLVVGSGIAVLALVAAGLMRGPAGLPLGWLVQVLTWVSAWWVPMMLAVGVIFTGLWVWCLLKGTRIDRSRAQEQAAQVQAARSRGS